MIAAKNIEPSTGASTWALGSHKCTPNIGNLTIMLTIVAHAIMVFILAISLPDKIRDISKSGAEDMLVNQINTTNRGMELAIV
jgi:hypothetical protein